MCISSLTPKLIHLFVTQQTTLAAVLVWARIFACGDTDMSYFDWRESYPAPTLEAPSPPPLVLNSATVGSEGREIKAPRGLANDINDIFLRDFFLEIFCTPGGLIPLHFIAVFADEAWAPIERYLGGLRKTSSNPLYFAVPLSPECIPCGQMASTNSSLDGVCAAHVIVGMQKARKGGKGGEGGGQKEEEES
jgi:hypothetical protein